MAFVFDPKTAKIRVRLTELGKNLYAESLRRLEELHQDDAVRFDSPMPTVAAPDAQGYYEMQLWVFMRAFGGYGLLCATWLRQYTIDDSYVITTLESATSVTYPG